jgi:hypothetical protein
VFGGDEIDKSMCEVYILDLVSAVSPDCETLLNVPNRLGHQVGLNVPYNIQILSVLQSFRPSRTINARSNFYLIYLIIQPLALTIRRTEDRRKRDDPSCDTASSPHYCCARVMLV